MSVRIPSKLTGLELVAEPLEASPELGYTWLKCPSHLNVGHQLGSGEFGTAVKVTRDDIKGPDGKNAEFVAKLFPKSHFYNTRKNVENEVKLIRKVKSDHIVRCFVLYENEEYFVAIFEFARGGDLTERLETKIKTSKGNPTRAFSEKEAASIIAQVLDAAYCIHKKNVIHRDIKTGNIFFKYPQEEKTEILLGDFGFSIGKDVQEKGFPGSLFYSAPELILVENYGEKVDIWAIGVVAFKLLSGNVPFSGTTLKNLNLPPNASEAEVYDAQMSYVRNNIVNKPVRFSPRVWSNVSEDAKAFIRGCLEKDPETRMSAEEALNHNWITNNTNAAKKLNAKVKWSDPDLLKKVAALNISSRPTSRAGSEAEVDSKTERTGRVGSRGAGNERATTPSPSGRPAAGIKQKLEAERHERKK